MNIKDLYLLAYNAGMCAGWGVILAKMVKHLADGGSASTVYPNVATLLCIFQTGAVAEIVHAALGLVRSPVATTFLQVLSRLLVLYGAVRIGDTEATKSPVFAQIVMAWGLSEVIRYSFYGANLLKVKLAPLTWLRYSAFMVLYPVGITGEIGCLYKSLPWIAEHKPWSVELPNTMNFTFSWYNCVWFILLGIYPYGSYVMYSYMLGQRRKVLTQAGAEAAKKSL
ncbi:putative mitochondrial Protein tyrosine phosphatase [Leptomonas pyrrhocoris]|uniref:very-long-chain (3R)-3-hydroxyacyl-CoA dehydratase n=1 Tax=Leptomonas pyrrhocoris TaxID=157538 RepID=A0A0N0VFK5_LEPPY|nr:putative mitochondrial Protein tyrosine phosphatase [Leptomonas pyrrhocoris]KPA80782.1 putative mitochondrial Protein tyrosine phosphatase [Leptomonas pyrrhocoris]|eukprot:XP_015659221.1 putative mitochondrial Protein tyrosine phosphatase [Leptomonas pyrrhocoris]